MRFKGLDLNLLAALDVLIEERSVSRAAERLHLSQPSVSAALARLRDYFNDPLLEIQGKRMVPTARALQLVPMLKELLADVETMVLQARPFEPATANRWFRICVSDYLATVLISRLVTSLQADAPGIRFDLQQPSDATPRMLALGELDLALMPQEHCLNDHPMELLFEERHVVAGWAQNPLLQKPVTEDEFYAAGHVAVSIGQVNRASFAENNLLARGRDRRIEIRASSFVMVPELLAGTDRLAVMHERLAKTLSARYPLAWCPLPFEFPVMREMIQYHRSRALDPSLLWLISRIRAAAE
jgi:LysR family transcriptional regulator, nod-box dependent transcriptional activator